jgi:hypothetical protein
VIWVCGEAEFFSKKKILFESGWTGNLICPSGKSANGSAQHWWIGIRQ